MLTKRQKYPLHYEAGIFNALTKVLKKQLFSRFLLLLALRNSNSHGDGGADHGVVAHAQKAHHFHGRNRLWRFLNWGTRVPEEVSLSFLNARHTSIFIA